jgi:hypothetical protein
MYQVADIFNGPIEGATFASYGEAHDYREFILPDYAEFEMEAMELLEEQNAESYWREVRPITIEQVRSSIRNFIRIVEV